MVKWKPKIAHPFLTPEICFKSSAVTSVPTKKLETLLIIESLLKEPGKFTKPTDLLLSEFCGLHSHYIQESGISDVI